MEDPEDRLDDVILNGVALRPRVNSERKMETFTEWMTTYYDVCMALHF